MDNEHLPPIRLKYADSRESEYKREKLLEYGWNQSALTNGDYSFQAYDYKWVGVTLKTVTDLIGSIGERFSYQLENMLDAYNTNIIMIEGSWKHLTPEAVTLYNGNLANMTWDSVWNYLHRFLAKGFILELTTSEIHTIHRLNALFALYQKPYSQSGKSKDYVDDRVLSFPSGCRGKSAMSLLKGRSLREVACMSEDWYKENGTKIGEKKASQIWTHFNMIKD
jgi:ERCC4-type nuclease